MSFIFTRQTHSHSPLLPLLPLLQSLSLLPISKISNFLQIRLSISQNSTRFSLLMSIPLELDYIGLSEMEKISKLCTISSESDKSSLLNLKATELRLGLPGLCQDLEENCCKNSPLMKNNSNVSGSKRGFSDVNFDGSAKWGFNGGSESDLGSKSLVLLRINGGLESKQTQEIIATHVVQEKKKDDVNSENNRAPSAKAQVVGWPPIRSFRKNTMATNSSKNGDEAERNSGCEGCLYVKVSKDGAPYLRKVDLKTCKNYTELSKALEKMFNCFTLGQCTSSGLQDKEGLTESNLKDLLHRAECVLTYEDKDGDWMLVGDVPWEMFVDSCRRLRIMKGSEAIGLGPRSTEKCKNKTQQI